MKRLKIGTRLFIWFSILILIAALISLFFYILTNVFITETNFSAHGIKLVNFHKKIIVAQFIITFSLFIIGTVLTMTMMKQLLQPLTYLKQAMINLSNGVMPKMLNDRQLQSAPEEISDVLNEYNHMVNTIQEEKQSLIRATQTDELTGIANRRLLNDQLEYDWSHAKRFQQPLSIAILDVDLFKGVNDRYGHQVGDQRLKQISHTIDQSLQKPQEFVARYGGEEFLIVLPNTTIREATFIAEKIRQQIEDLRIPLNEPKNQYVTTSIGVTSLVPTNEMNKETLIEFADKALYEAKMQGRNRVVAKVG